MDLMSYIKMFMEVYYSSLDKMYMYFYLQYEEKDGVV